MKKTILLLTLSLMSLQLFAQSSIPYPTLAQFEAFRVKELDAAIKHAEYLSSSKINFQEYKLIKKSEVFGFRREDSKSIEGWPNDGCAVRYYYENPKIINGIQSKIEVVVEYKRSTCSADECVLEDNWSAYVVNVLPSYVDKGMSKTEADKLTELCIKSEFSKKNLLKDFIEIKAFSPYTYDETNPTYNFMKINSAESVEFRVNFSGTIGAYTSDKSIFLNESEVNTTIDFQLKFENGKWNVVGSTANFNEVFSELDKSLFNKEIPSKRFANYSEKGFEAIYTKRVEESTPSNNPLSNLMDFGKEFSTGVIANAEQLTEATFTKYFAQSVAGFEQEASENLKLLTQITTVDDLTKLKDLTLTSIEFKDYKEELVDNQLIKKGDISITLNSKEYSLKGKKAIETGNTKEIYLTLTCVLTDNGWKIVNI